MTSAWRAASLLAVALLLPACNLTFTTADDPLANSGAPQDPFALMTPLNDANGVQPLNTQFSWGAMPAAISYDLEVSLSSDFSRIVFQQSGITITSVFSTATLTYSTTYYWRIRGHDTSSSRLAAGSPYRFTTVSPLSPPSQFSLLAPSGANVSRTPGFAWTMSTNVSFYTLKLSTDPNVLNPIVTLANLHEPNATCPITLLPTQTYYWSVTAYNWLGSYQAPSGTFVTGP
ncbi:MAG TPA: hypothetical protein VNM14_19130 [Planctomycetota bacterium]|jgi:hypothetical protein|nr:hypothetical protein [Planctomycetota bacterium]